MSYNTSLGHHYLPLRTGADLNIGLDFNIESRIKMDRFLPDSLDYLPRYQRIFEDHFNFSFTGEEEYLVKVIETSHYQYIKTGEIIFMFVKRLAITLSLYIQVPARNRYLKAVDYIRGSLLYGPLYAAKLKKVRQGALIQSVSLKILESNQIFLEELKDREDTPPYLEDESYDYDSFLHERNLIPFKEVADDFPWAFKEVQENYNVLSVFRSVAYDLLSQRKVEDLKIPSSDEAATWISDSTTYSDDGPNCNRTLMREYAKRGESKELFESSKSAGYRFHRQSVFVEPGNARDTWQCYPETLFKVRRVSYLLRQIVNVLPQSAMADSLKAARRRRRLRKDDQVYYMFDYKKCGLTVNRNLLRILGEVLNSIYPSQFDELIQFSDVSVESSGHWFQPPRGVGLGNCNEGITLIQCVFGQILEGIQGLDSVFFNDDGVFISNEDFSRSPLASILSVGTGAGMIFNLKKTIVSRCNVFCEEYFTADTDLNYSKTQNWVTPFANCWFQPNIYKAKSLYYQLDKNLIGQRIGIEILSSLVDHYGYEFHKDDYLWPHEFGGWRHFGDTSVSECINFLYHWEDYIDSALCGSIPLMRRWVTYLIKSEKIRSGIIGDTQIKYRQYVRNPFIPREFHRSFSERATEMCRFLGEDTPLEKEESLDKLYNIRGLKNAKPKLKVGIVDKLQKARLSVWRSFKKSNIQTDLDRNVGCLASVMRTLRGNDITPKNFLPPRFLVEKDEYFSPADATGRSRLITDKHVSHDINVETLDSCLHSISQKRLNSGFDPDFFRDSIRRNKEKSIIANDILLLPEHRKNMPNYLYLFLPRKRYARLLYFYKYGRNPLRWAPDLGESELFDQLRDPIKYIFPEDAKSYRTLLKRLRNNPLRKDLLNVFHQETYYDRDDFASAILYFHQFITDEEFDPGPPKGGQIEALITGLDFISYEVADYEMGAPTLEDLLDDWSTDYSDFEREYESEMSDTEFYDPVSYRLDDFRESSD